MTRFYQCVLLLIVGAGLLELSPRLHGAPPSKSPAKSTAADESGELDFARRAVEQSLLQEMFSQVDRRTALDATLQRHPDSDLLRWSTGYVRDGDLWRSFEQTARAAADTDQRSRYAQRREQAPMTAAGQLVLANWCREQEMPAQERAHLSAVLALEPDAPHVDVHERLGDRLFGNQWLSADQVRKWIELNRRSRSSLAEWGAKLEKLATQLEGSRRQRDVAQASLRELTDPAVIPAMEYTLCGRNLDAAIAAVNAFQRMIGSEATLALAKQAVFSKEQRVREQATEALKVRPLEEFAPGLIGLLATPAKAEFGQRMWRTARVDSNGDEQLVVVLLFSYVIARETDDQFQVRTLTTVDHRLNQYRYGLVSGDSNKSPIMNKGSGHTLDRIVNDLSRSRAEENYQAEKQLRAINRRTDELNARVIDVLVKISGQPPDPRPQNWWKWWEAYSDTQRVDKKRVVRVDETDVRGTPGGIPIQPVRISHGVPGILLARLQKLYTNTLPLPTSCFTAGTPVWTDSGMLPIEELRIGDLVLAKDVETGELTCQPVLHTSVRPAKELVRVLVDDETITATGGHRFWVSGKGWIKARDLKPGMLLHTVTGTRSVGSVVPGPVEPTYNLVVDDFHSYFVGRTGFLVQDLPLPQPTNSVVPGLSKAQVTANGFVLP